MMMQSMNPNMYMKWMMSPLDPRAMQLMTAPMNPAMYTGWMNSSMNPTTYGSWGNFMNPATYGVPAVGAPTGAPGINFFDPNTLLMMMNPSTFMAPAAAPAPAPAK